MARSGPCCLCQGLSWPETGRGRVFLPEMARLEWDLCSACPGATHNAQRGDRFPKHLQKRPASLWGLSQAAQGTRVPARGLCRELVLHRPPPQPVQVPCAVGQHLRLSQPPCTTCSVQAVPAQLTQACAARPARLGARGGSPDQAVMTGASGCSLLQSTSSSLGRLGGSCPAPALRPWRRLGWAH